MSALTVVLPTRDRPEMMERAARSIRLSLRPDDELIVVDSRSRPPVHVEDGLLVRCEQVGASRARNAGWRAARHPVVAFVDDDVVVDVGWAEAIATAFDTHPDAGFITGRLAPLTPVDYPVAVKDDASAAALTWASAGVLGHGANMAVRRSALVGVGGWDELLGAGARFRAAEDLDLMDRLLAAGWTGRYEPAAMAWHDQWRSKGERLVLAWRYGVGMGARIAKLQRRDPARAAAMAREALWEHGVRDASFHARRGYKMAFALNVLNVVGATNGWVRACASPLVGGQFRVRR
jgi:GT2 family glycosyltransferase